MSVIRLPAEHLLWINLGGIFMNMWSIKVAELPLIRVGRVMQELNYFQDSSLDKKCVHYPHPAGLYLYRLVLWQWNYF